MDFEFRHLFPCTAQQLWDLLQSDPYRVAACEAARIDKHILEDRPDLRGHFRSVRVVPRRKLPAVLARAVDSDVLSYVQEQRWDGTNKRMKWVVISDISPDRVTCRGDVVVRDRGRGECERVVTGVLRIAVPLVGPRIEKKSISDLAESYEVTAGVIRQLLV